MEVMARVLGYYGRNRDQQTCVCQRSAFDEISHDRAGTCDRKPPGFTFDHHRIDLRCLCLPVSSFSKLALAPSFLRGHRSRRKLHL